MKNSNLPIEKNREYTIDIESVTSEGMGVGHVDGFCVFVPMTAEGDRVKALIVKVKSGYAYAKCTDIIKKSKHRREPVCPAFGKCGGCQLMHIEYEKQLEIKKSIIENAFKRIGNIDLKVSRMIGADDEFRYRNKMIFPFGNDKAGKTVCGFYRERSHDVIPLEDCYLGDDINSEIISAVMSFMDKYKISVYDENSHSGVVRRLFIRKGAFSGEVMVVLSVNADKFDRSKELADCILSVSDRIKSIIVNHNTKKTNAVLGDKNTLIYGSETISDTLCFMRYEISAGSFYQINPVQTEKLYNTAIDMANIGKSDTVIDLYCGIGTISLCAARKADRVVGVEVVEQAIENARKNADSNGVNNVAFYAGEAERVFPQLVENGINPNVIILDPPRKGSDEITLSAAVKASPDRIVYVSCNPATLARDLRFLSDNGYAPVEAAGVDMFPQTVHVETVVLLCRKTPDDVINVKLSLDELELTSAESKATYEKIKEYVMRNFGLKVSTLYIAQTKRKLGIAMGENYNMPKSLESTQPQCPPDKEAAIVKALEHFKMI